MIYSLTPKQKQAIEDALEEINFISTTKKALPRYMDILTIIQSLKPSEPVALVDTFYLRDMTGTCVEPEDLPNNALLFALEQP